MINFGGVDKSGITSKVLHELKKCTLPENLTITIVLGINSPNIEAVRLDSSFFPKTKIVIGAENMAELMSEADIAIGAAGSTSWERCVLGLPSIILVLAENQITVAQMLAKAKAVVSLNSLDQLPQVVDDRQNWMTEIGKNCSKVLDGKGVERVIQNLESWPKRENAVAIAYPQ